MRHEEFMKEKFREEKTEMVQNIINTADRIGSKIDMVNSPPHYNQTGIECIHAISAATLPSLVCSFGLASSAYTVEYKITTESVKNNVKLIKRVRIIYFTMLA